LSVVHRCYGNNLSWYLVLSNVTSYTRERWGLFRDSLYQNVIDIGPYFLKLFWM